MRLDESGMFISLQSHELSMKEGEEVEHIGKAAMNIHH
jgi:hypothetical protein